MIRVAGPDLAPVEAARRLGGAPGRFLLHSASDDDGLGRWSFCGAWPEEVLAVDRIDEEAACPFAALEARLRARDPGPPADGAPLPLAVAMLGYDLGRAVERLPSRARRDHATPDLWVGFYGAVWRHDARTGRGEIVGSDAGAAERLAAALARPVAEPPPPPRLGALRSEMSDEVYRAAVARILAYITAGDVYQVNLSRRLRADVRAPGDPLWLLSRQGERTPAPYGALLDMDGATVISNSPERFLYRAAGSPRVETRPIKGTRARGRRPEEDAALAAALAADPKERAEHLMIVDLLRNDLGRVARVGTVAVEAFGRVVPLPTVHHMVSTVACELREGVGLAALLRAAFPGGSITGAPKVRAMEIIEELEPVRRGVYTGALGVFGAGGAIDLSIAIRTAVLSREALTLHVGGGIVADSRPDRELEETEEKAAAWRQTLG